eukprot:GEMP01080010.1.p1 GENE.GEMP01080010.1~~GEMP01080010.1.p1  ORF type:complete len:299 (+),score=62.15 GEMP01080010.1:47-898(+)
MSLRVKRQKKVHRILRHYRVTFDLQEPYKLLCDPTFIFQSLEKKVHIKEQIPKLLGARVTPMVTNCGMAELRRLKTEIGDKFLGALIIAKGFYRVKCNHEEPITASKCIEELMSERDKKWMIASQDNALRAVLRAIPGIPILTLSGQVPTLEPPSESSTSVHHAQELEKLKVADWERPKLVEKKRLETIAEIAGPKKDKKKRKRGRHPHPLSCLKKKKKPAGPTPPRTKKEVKTVIKTVLKSDTEEANAKRKRRKRSKKKKVCSAEGDTTTGVAVSVEPGADN